MTRAKASEILQFLVRSGLVIEKNGAYLMRTRSTWLGRESPHLVKHHTNWRIRAIEKSESLSEAELMYSRQVFALAR